ncbi:MAG: deoxyribonuclease IV [Planctomycetaceae bacterium]|nr:deoxyribonuclease IV [Planctomycetaceae bacterium]
MFRVGSHISSAKGYFAMGKDAVKIGANTFQFFLRNPRGGRAKAIDPADVAKFLAFADEHGISSILAHASYVLNIATDDERLQTFVQETVADDLVRLANTPGAMYNIHPGTRKDRPYDAAVASVAENLDAAIPAKMSGLFLLETMSGHGGELGGRFEELQDIMSACKQGRKFGVCLDTCHVFSAGYDIVGDLDGVLAEFDKAVGLDKLKAIHLNDSMFPLGSHKDRHAKLGEGEIGWDAISRIINHPQLRDLPFYLETPNELDGYAEEIAELKKRYGGKEAKKKAPAAKKAAPARTKKNTK